MLIGLRDRGILFALIPDDAGDGHVAKRGEHPVSEEGPRGWRIEGRVRRGSVGQGRIEQLGSGFPLEGNFVFPGTEPDGVGREDGAVGGRSGETESDRVASVVGSAGNKRTADRLFADGGVMASVDKFNVMSVAEHLAVHVADREPAQCKGGVLHLRRNGDGCTEPVDSTRRPDRSFEFNRQPLSGGENGPGILKLVRLIERADGTTPADEFLLGGEIGILLPEFFCGFGGGEQGVASGPLENGGGFRPGH